MKFITCPHCGQIQMLSDDGKCIKCATEIKTYGGSDSKRSLGPFYECPNCNHIQAGESDRCEKCRSKMSRNGIIAPILATIFGVFAFLALSAFIYGIYTIMNDGFSYLADSDKESMYALIFFLVLNIALFCFSVRIALAPPQKRLKIVRKDYPFCNIDGIPGASFESSGNMSFVEDGQTINFSIGDHFLRSLEFSQVIGISFGNYNYTELKPFVGGVSVGNVYIHGSPVREKSKPFFQIRYRSCEPGKGEGVIRVIFKDWICIEDLKFLSAWIGLQMDPAYIVESEKNL